MAAKGLPLSTISDQERDITNTLADCQFRKLTESETNRLLNEVKERHDAINKETT